jgi:hypothetical protein
MFERFRSLFRARAHRRDSDPITSLPERSHFHRRAIPITSPRVAFTEKLVDKIGDLDGALPTGVVNVSFSGIRGKSAATIQGRAPQPGESPRGYYSP